MKNNTEEYYQQVGEYFNVMAEKFVGKREENAIFKGMRASFRAYTTHPSPNNILDIGCGGGDDAIFFARKYPQAMVYGIDVSEKMISIAEANKAHNAISNVHFIKAGLENIEHGIGKDIRFDIIYIYFGALNTVSSLDNAATTIEKLLAPGGKAVLTVINKYYLSEFFIHFVKGNWKKATLRWTKKWTGYSPQMSLPSSTYTPSSIKSAFKNLSLTATEGYSIFYPAWFQADWLARFPRLCKILYKMDRFANKTPFWKFGEYTLFVYEKKAV